MKRIFIVVAVVAMAFTACSKKKTENTTTINKTDNGSAAGSDMGSAMGSDAAPAPATP
jgi:hypothetical protein